METNSKSNISNMQQKGLSRLRNDGIIATKPADQTSKSFKRTLSNHDNTTFSG